MNVKEFNTIIDKMLEGAVSRLPENFKPCCSRCATPHCCSEVAYCDDHQVDAMLDSLQPQQLAEVAENTRAWLEKARPFLKVERPNAFQWRLANIPCPLLSKEGKCMAYENRPMDCRMFLALGKPEDCAMPERMKQKYAEFPTPNALQKLQAAYISDNLPIELDHIGAHLVRKVLGFADFTTAAHVRYEPEPEPKR